SAPEGTLPARVTLFQNYPNPFNPATIIRWHQPHAGAAEILIFNVLGQRLASFKPSETAAGLRQIEIDFSHNPSGIYFYQVKVAETYSEIKKMVLAK
ncbi:T9SS C-terminal target domain-containing protein, partial [candidate division KSB1 bacterium]|nr:T9SS C-terminal target domain-containing protein [candidate division KSB1 bacterium]